MSRYSKHEIALVTELLADKLIRVYRGEQIPAMVDAFASAGFTQTTLKSNPVKLFQMLVIAAYDRRPFTPAAGGFEEIWGMRPGAQSIPKALQTLSLFTPQGVRSVDRHTLRRWLDAEPYFGRSLATDGEFVQFDQTLLDLTGLIETDFHAQVLEASTTEDVRALYRRLRGVHGIGETIGSKLVKYLLREIGLGHIAPDAFPLSLVWPITNEYHISLAAQHLSITLDAALMPLTMGVLLSRGEPFAVDGLFYLHRHRNWELDEFVEEAKEILPAPRGRADSPPAEGKHVSDKRLAQTLLAVIKEIYEAAQGISSADIKNAGLQGVVTAQQIEASARRLHTEMGQLASEGKAGEMVRFYENCLQSDKGKLVGWALQKLERVSMESEAERFREIYLTRST